MKTLSDVLLDSGRLCRGGPYFDEKGVGVDLTIVPAMVRKIEAAYHFAFQLPHAAETDHPEFAEMADCLLKALDEA